MRELLGVEPGSVTPFAVLNDKERRVSVVLDAAMMTHELLHFHPLTNTGTTTIARADLVKFLTATGHPPRIEVLTGDHCVRPNRRLALAGLTVAANADCIWPVFFPFNRTNRAFAARRGLARGGPDGVHFGMISSGSRLLPFDKRALGQGHVAGS